VLRVRQGATPLCAEGRQTRPYRMRHVDTTDINRAGRDGSVSSRIDGHKNRGGVHSDIFLRSFRTDILAWLGSLTPAPLCVEAFFPFEFLTTVRIFFSLASCTPCLLGWTSWAASLLDGQSSISPSVGFSSRSVFDEMDAPGGVPRTWLAADRVISNENASSRDAWTKQSERWDERDIAEDGVKS